MDLYNSINAGVVEDHPALPADCAFRRDALANLDESAPVVQWSRGFVLGHQWLEDVWERYIPEDLDSELAAVMMTLSFFASRELAEALMAVTTTEDLAALTRTMRRSFRDALTGYAQMGRAIQQAHMASQGSTPEPMRSVKTGRNERCPCGSGGKYKKCCGAG